jgi:putative selenate reductase molybdopterin-binding subunit
MWAMGRTASAQHPLRSRYRLHQPPPAGAYRGYGVPQGFWPVERHMEKIARTLGLRPDRIPPEKCPARRRAASPSAPPGAKGASRVPRHRDLRAWKNASARAKRQLAGIRSTATPNGTRSRQAPPAARDWCGPGDAGHCHPLSGYGRRQPQDERRWLVQPADRRNRPGHRLGHRSGADGGRSAGRIPLEDILVYSSDTDFTPFDKGAYASSTTYISGQR